MPIWIDSSPLLFGWETTVPFKVKAANMDGIPLFEIRSCIDLGLLGSRRSFLAIVGLIQLVTDAASLLFKCFHIYTAGFRQFIHSTDGMIGIILGILKNVLGFFIGFVEIRSFCLAMLSCFSSRRFFRDST